MPESRLERTRRAYYSKASVLPDLRQCNPSADEHWWKGKMGDEDSATRCLCGAVTWGEALERNAKGRVEIVDRLAHAS